MKKKALCIALTACVAGTGVAASYAADALVGGRRLVIKNKVPDNERRNRILVAARSGALVTGIQGGVGDPTCSGAGGGGGRITFASPTSGAVHTTDLPCRNWSAGRGTYRYRDREVDDGTCKLIVIRGGRVLRASCTGSGPTDLDYDLVPGQSQNPVNVTLELGSLPNRYCLSFGGQVRADGSSGKSFIARNSPPPASCPLPPGSPSGAFVDGPILP